MNTQRGCSNCFRRLDVLVDHTPRTGPLQMALDEILLAEINVPLLRIYTWDDSWVSMGCFTRHIDAESAFPDRPLVRRWTGGGIVDHSSDFTYSLVVPTSEPLAHQSTVTSYSMIHQALACALAIDGVAARLAVSAPCPTRGGLCFGAPVKADVVGPTGRKIAGAAQRRTRLGLLHQGSLQLPRLPPGFPMNFAHSLAPEVTEPRRFPGDITIARANSLAREKYASTSWLRRH